jgi:hypothetical protein
LGRVEDRLVRDVNHAVEALYNHLGIGQQAGTQEDIDLRSGLGRAR